MALFCLLIKIALLALANVAQWIERQPANQRHASIFTYIIVYRLIKGNEIKSSQHMDENV